MPVLSAIQIAIFFVALIVGIIVGWYFRGSRSSSEKAAINAGWQEQLEAQRNEHERLLEQNQSLMEQNSQYQASNKDSKMRASELSDALKEAFERRDELQRQIKDIRSSLETAVQERDRLQNDVAGHEAASDATSSALERRDEQIEKLNRELGNWQQRVTPLIEKFRARNDEVLQLDEELAAARERIDALEAMMGSDETRVEPVDPNAMRDGLDASNDPIEAEAVDELRSHAEHEPPTEFEDEAQSESEDEIEEDADDHAHPEPEDELEHDGEDAIEEELDGEMEDLFGTEVTGEFKQENEQVEVAGDAFDDAAEELLAPEELEELIDAQDTPGISGGGANGEHRDDLQLIKGVGPAIEKTLNEMGICRFDQIAEMSEYEIDRIARKLKGFRSRIYREDWIGQARDLDEQKSRNTG